MWTSGRDDSTFDHRTGAGTWGCVWETAVEACDTGKRLWSMGGIDDEAKVDVNRLMANMTMTIAMSSDNTAWTWSWKFKLFNLSLLALSESEVSLLSDE